MSAVPTFTIRDLLESGVHFGHRTSRWNPRMAPYLFGSRNGIHIIDLQQTAPLLHKALKLTYEVVKNNGRVLFVGTKRQASEPIAEAAKRCGQYFVNYRWLGGMLTNWHTVSQSIKTLRDMDRRLAEGLDGLKKKETLELQRKRDKLNLSLGGIMDMGGKPDLVFVIDTNRESIAVAEARKLGIPVIGVLDSNSDPQNIDYPVPGNDDATRAIRLYCQLISDAVLAGIQESLSRSGVDIGAAEEVPMEAILEKEEEEELPRKPLRGKRAKEAAVAEKVEVITKGKKKKVEPVDNAAAGHAKEETKKKSTPVKEKVEVKTEKHKDGVAGATKKASAGTAKKEATKEKKDVKKVASAKK